MNITSSFSPAEQQTLLRLARQALLFYFQRHRRPAAEECGIAISPAMREERGVFVTLHLGGELRGCIGEIIPRRPLYLAVIDQAINAAVNDPRFLPLTAAELPLVQLEISVLSRPRPIGSWQEIAVGRHGVLLEKGGHSSVFLPQVAPEQGWNREEMLDHLACKAGLSPEAWRQGAHFQVFEAQVFGEPEK